MDALRFGPLDDVENGARNRRIVSGVVAGIAHYGNCFGVPTVGGECVFEPDYNGNPLVNVFALGVFKKDEIFYAKAAGVGNPVIDPASEELFLIDNGSFDVPTEDSYDLESAHEYEFRYATVMSVKRRHVFIVFLMQLSTYNNTCHSEYASSGNFYLP